METQIRGLSWCQFGSKSLPRPSSVLSLNRSTLQGWLRRLHLRHAGELLHESRGKCRAASLHLQLGLHINA
jgi:hypothetical protein